MGNFGFELVAPFEMSEASLCLHKLDYFELGKYSRFDVICQHPSNLRPDFHTALLFDYKQGMIDDHIHATFFDDDDDAP